MEEIRTLNTKISEQKQERVSMEEELNETQFQRTKLEQKVKTVKQKSITDQVTMQQDLKTSIQIGGTARDLSSTTIWGRRESMVGESVPNP